MCCVVASIGSDGLLGTEALQSCLPHQLDLRTGLLWAEGRSTLQLHQQKPTPDVRGLLLTAVVLPPDSEVVAPFSLNGGQLGSCALIVPDRDLTEEFGVVVGHTLVDASTSSANVLIINPNAEEVVLPCRTSIGQLVLISAVSVARSEVRSPTNTAVVLPEYLEDIVKGSHISLGDTGRQSLRELLLRYEHVFPAPGDPVTGRTKSVQHEILGFPTEKDRFVLDTDASLFAIGGVLSQIQNEEEVVIVYTSRSLQTSQHRYCTTQYASGSGHVYTLPVIPTGQSVYPENGP